MSEQTPNKFSIFDLPNLPESIDNAAKNLTDKPTKNMGTTFADCWYLVFGGISHVANKKRMKYAMELEAYQDELSKAINSIPNDKRVEPSIQVTAQALENSKYCISSATLREMFVNLISGTMHADLEPHVHPSFPEILKQLSEVDALTLQILKQKIVLPIANIGIRIDENSQQVIATNACSFISNDLSVIDCAVSIASLGRAGIISTSYAEHLSSDATYDAIKKSYIYRDIEAQCNAFNKEIYFQKGVCRLTALGNEFIHTCVS